MDYVCLIEQHGSNTITIELDLVWDQERIFLNNYNIDQRIVCEEFDGDNNLLKKTKNLKILNLLRSRILNTHLEKESESLSKSYH